MMKKYIKSYYDLLLEKKVNLEEDLSNHQTELDGYLNRINELKNDSKDSMLGFYPSMADFGELDEIDKYQSLIDTCKSEMEVIQNNIQNVELDIRNVLSEIQLLKEEESKKLEENRKIDLDKVKAENMEDVLANFYNIIHICEDEKSVIKNKFYDSIIRRIESIKKRIDLSCDIINIDPVRCKLELGVVSNLIDMTNSDITGILYNLNSITFNDEEPFEVLLNRVFSNIKNIAGDSLILSSNGAENIDTISPVIKYYLLFFIDKCCSVFINDFNAEKIDFEMDLQKDNIFLSIACIGKEVLSDYLNCLNNIDIEKNNCKIKGVDGFSIIASQLKFLSAQIKKCCFENGRNIINVIIPLYI